MAAQPALYCQPAFVDMFADSALDASESYHTPPGMHSMAQSLHAVASTLGGLRDRIDGNEDE
eukprot:CAMPEP_0197856378 /NCGR_PEP_ID=MMETSP1438-20131217/28443_1 /TAXON_ID=1461541 /ORGANISM="Pterosperma sp., Strain CCMP1384" /LENGTH=61 /DNA_ID=CAMNT_0043471813 /DNA_START=65 /DNA_END=247 /DNA_ORIENTATION=-